MKSISALCAALSLACIVLPAAASAGTVVDTGTPIDSSNSSSVFRSSSPFEFQNLAVEFTLGQERVQELAGGLGFPFLAGNVTDEWKEMVFPPTRMVERGGVRIGIIGQAFPFTPVANPRWMVPEWTFGIQEETGTLLLAP